ncbi:hypothetical protein SAY86_007800 [Trapa natans]|uniref:O-fucosyltransferase family protein n=1 Tax=Trapa natans TaxID=22666 RepID=A0AAN7LMD0_TRANT|nr:hypothetical protein SAY86_007800 [Trapa natans]
MKGEGKAGMKSKLKWVGLTGLLLSSLSISVHFFLAMFTEHGVSDYQTSVTFFSWLPIIESASNIPKTSPLYRRLWGPVRHLQSLHPHANPRGYYADLSPDTRGYIFVRIQGGFHEIGNSIGDAVAVSRLLNATLVVPEIQSTTSSKGIRSGVLIPTNLDLRYDQLTYSNLCIQSMGCSSDFKSFSYLYNEEQFISALAKDVKVIKTLPKGLKCARKEKKIPLFRVPYRASPYFYLHHVLPVLIKHSVVELVISNGGCLQAILPPQFEEYQRLRCRVAFHALRFREEVEELAAKILQRLRSPGRPYIAYDPGMTREALAYYGCAELFQDVHNELIQHKRSWMIKRKLIKGKLSVDSAAQRFNGSCPLTPEEVGILLRAYGYSWDTIIYVSGGEVFGGQRALTPLHGMFDNVVDRTFLSASWEMNRLYGRETNLIDDYPKNLPAINFESKHQEWKLAGPRPRPLPPPPARPKYPYNIEGWWGWVAESDDEPESTVMELRMNAHKLLWEAIDYIVCVEADVFIPGFDRDGKGHPNFASLVMGHRLYQSATSRTYLPDRKEVAKLLEQTRDHLYQANATWVKSVRRLMRKSLLDRLSGPLAKSKSLSFLSHPVPECSCSSYDLQESQLKAALGAVHLCPSWMNTGSGTVSREKESEEDMDEYDTLTSSSRLFFGNPEGSHEIAGEVIKEETRLEDQEELEGGER